MFLVFDPHHPKEAGLFTPEEAISVFLACCAKGLAVSMCLYKGVLP